MASLWWKAELQHIHPEHSAPDWKVPGASAFYFLRFYLFIFRERGREGEREGKKHRSVVSLTPPTRDMVHNPDMCPDQIEPVTFGFAGWYPTHWDIPVRAWCLSFWLPSNPGHLQQLPSPSPYRASPPAYDPYLFHFGLPDCGPHLQMMLGWRGVALPLMLPEEEGIGPGRQFLLCLLPQRCPIGTHGSPGSTHFLSPSLFLSKCPSTLLHSSNTECHGS